jgi:hypothetical protein
MFNTIGVKPDIGNNPTTLLSTASIYSQHQPVPLNNQAHPSTCEPRNAFLDALS